MRSWVTGDSGDGWKKPGLLWLRPQGLVLAADHLEGAVNLCLSCTVYAVVVSSACLVLTFPVVGCVRFLPVFPSHPHSHLGSHKTTGDVSVQRTQPLRLGCINLQRTITVNHLLGREAPSIEQQLSNIMKENRRGPIGRRQCVTTRRQHPLWERWWSLSPT